MQAAAQLPEQHRAGRVELDGDGDGHEQRAEQQQEQAGEHQLRGPADEQHHLVARRGAEGQQRQAAELVEGQPRERPRQEVDDQAGHDALFLESEEHRLEALQVVQPAARRRDQDLVDDVVIAGGQRRDVLEGAEEPVGRSTSLGQIGGGPRAVADHADQLEAPVGVRLDAGRCCPHFVEAAGDQHPPPDRAVEDGRPDRAAAEHHADGVEQQEQPEQGTADEAEPEDDDRDRQRQGTDHQRAEQPRHLGVQGAGGAPAVEPVDVEDEGPDRQHERGQERQVVRERVDRTDPLGQPPAADGVRTGERRGGRGEIGDQVGPRDELGALRNHGAARITSY